MKTKIRAVTTGMAVCLMLVLLLCANIYAATVYTEGTLYYIIQDNSITITGCFGKDEEVEVPSMIAGIPVNTIGTGAFSDNEYVKTVIIPDTVTSIEDGAFGSEITVIYQGSQETTTLQAGTDSNQNDSGSDQNDISPNKNASSSIQNGTDQSATTADTVQESSSVSGSGNVAEDRGVSFDEADVTLDDEDFPDSNSSAVNESAKEINQAEADKGDSNNPGLLPTEKEDTGMLSEKPKVVPIICGIAVVAIVIVLIVIRKQGRKKQ